MQSSPPEQSSPPAGAHGSFSPRLIVLIGPYEFRICAPYSEGHVLTVEEASAFNEFRARGIVNNTRGLVNEASQQANLARGELLSDATLAWIQREITRFDLGYTHPAERGSRRHGVRAAERTRGAVETIAWELAGVELAASCKRYGRMLGQADFDAERETLAASPTMRATVRQILRRRAQEIEI